MSTVIVNSPLASGVIALLANTTSYRFLAPDAHTDQEMSRSDQFVELI